MADKPKQKQRVNEKRRGGQRAGVIGYAATLPAAAAKLNLPLALVKKLKADGWSCFRPNSSVDCDELMAELSKQPELLKEFDGVPDKRIEDALLTRAKRRREEQKLETESGALIPRTSARYEAARCILACKMKLVSNIDSITAAAAMKLALDDAAVNDLRRIVTDATYSALKDMTRGEWGDVGCPNCNTHLE